MSTSAKIYLSIFMTEVARFHRWMPVRLGKVRHRRHQRGAASGQATLIRDRHVVYGAAGVVGGDLAVLVASLRAGPTGRPPVPPRCHLW